MGDEGRMETGVGTWAPGGGEKSTPTLLAYLLLVACHRAEKPPRLRASWGASPTLVLCHLCVVGPLHVWVGGFGFLGRLGAVSVGDEADTGWDIDGYRRYLV